MYQAESIFIKLPQIRVLADIWKQGVQIESLDIVIDFCMSKVWYKIHTTNKVDPIPLQILLF